MKIFLMALLMIASMNVDGQRTSQKPAFGAFAAGGVAIGDKLNGGIAQVVPGVHYKNWFAGAGAGMDWYPKKSLPVFVDVRRRLLIAKNINALLYADGGWNLVKKEKIENTWYRWYNNDGKFFEAGAGLWHPTGKRQFFTITAGYSYKSYTI